MMDFKKMKIEELQKYIGAKVYIVHPGCYTDEYWKSIDSVSPHIICAVIDEFNISTLGLEILTDNGQESYNVDDWKIFLDKKSAQKEIQNGL